MNKRDREEITSAFLLVAVTVAACVVLTQQCACSPAVDARAENAETSGGYLAQLKACVDKATTKAESVACRCDVNRRYQRECDR